MDRRPGSACLILRPHGDILACQLRKGRQRDQYQLSTQGFREVRGLGSHNTQANFQSSVGREEALGNRGYIIPSCALVK